MARKRRNSSTTPNPRSRRAAEELRHALVRVLAEGGIRDPELAEASITVTEADVSPDLRNVTYLVTPLGGFGDGPAMLRSLKRAAPFLRRRVAEIVNLKFAPEIRFRLDRSFDAAQRIESLLSKPEVRRDLEAPAAADESQPEKA